MILMLGDEGTNEQVIHALRWDSHRDRARPARHAPSAHRIGITIADGVATLAGEVDSWAEKEAAFAVVRDTPGVCGIDDLIRVADP